MRLRAAVAITALFLLQQSPALAARPAGDDFRPASKIDPATRKTRQQIADQLGKAAEALQNGQFQTAYDLLKPLMDTTLVKELPPEHRHGILFMFATVAAQVGAGAEAYGSIKQSSVLEGATGYDWLMRFYLARDQEQPRDAVDSIAVLSRDFPATLREIDLDYINASYRETRDLKDGAELRLILLEALYIAKWKPADDLDDPYWFWTDYATRLVETGDHARASAVTRLITAPGEIIRLRADRRFDPIVREASARFDPVTAAKANLTKARAQAAAHPDRLKAVTRLADALLMLNQTAEALVVLDEAIAKTKPVLRPGTKPVFTDVGDQLTWALNLRSIALMRLGRDEEGMAALREGARRPEGGRLNTSQALNLGNEYNDRGRPKEALEAISTVESMSEYGLGVKLQVEACAHAQLGDAKAMRASVDELRKLVAFNPGAIEVALLCANDLDAVAAIWIKRLNDPEKRGELLFKVQDFPPQTYGGAYKAEINRRFELVRARPDVQAEINKVGRIEKIELYPLY